MQTLLLVARVKMEMTQVAVAKYLGISAKQYREKEKGKTCFTSDEMFKLAKLFNKKIEDIFLPR